jgi:hypothetical protein
MGTSFVEYRGFGFWSRDSFISEWLDALLEEMRSLQSSQPWQVSLMEHWRGQAAIDGGMMSLGLDEFLRDGNRREIVASLARKAVDHTSPSAHRTGELFIDLLDGKLKTTVGSPIDYLDDVG